MKRFKIYVSAISSFEQEYIIYASSPAVAKKKAIKRLKDESCDEDWDEIQAEIISPKNKRSKRK